MDTEISVEFPSFLQFHQKFHFYGGPQVSHANKKITTQTKVTARKQKLAAPKKKLTAPKKKLTAPKKKLTAPKKCSRHQRKTHGTK
jgi:hypothetical protein